MGCKRDELHASGEEWGEGPDSYRNELHSGPW